MEPFELTLSQVNFEEEDLSKEGDDDLHSFSNTFSYEDDFKDVDTTVGKPVSAKKVKHKTSVRDDGGHRSRSSLIDLIEGRNPSTQESHHKPRPDSQAASNTNHQHRNRMHACSPRASIATNQIKQIGDGYLTRYRDNRSLMRKFQDPRRNKKQAKEKEKARFNSTLEESFNEKSVPYEPAGSSFQAFTETVDALALQESVIGKKGLTPAPADEIAKAIAATQQLMHQGNNTADSQPKLISDSEETTPSLSEVLLNSSATPSHQPYTVPVEEISVEDEDSVLVAMKQQGKYSIYMTDGKTTAESSYGVMNMTSEGTETMYTQSVHSGAMESADTSEDSPILDSSRQSGKLSREGSLKSDHSDNVSGQRFVPGQARNLHLVRPPGRSPGAGDQEQGADTEFVAIPHKDLIPIPRDQIVITAEKSSSSWFSMSSATKTSPTSGGPNGPAAGAGDQNSPLDSRAKLVTTSTSNSTDKGSNIDNTNAINPEVNDKSNAHDNVGSVPSDYVDTSDVKRDDLASGTSVNEGETTASVKPTHDSRGEMSQGAATDLSDEHQTTAPMADMESSLSFTDSFVESTAASTQSTSTPIKGSATTEVSRSTAEVNVVKSQTSTSSGSIESETSNAGVKYIERTSHSSQLIDVSRIVQEHTVKQTFTQRPEVVENSDFKMYLHMSEELGKAMREKARLEGQVEVLETEAKQTLNERADLQAQVAALKEKLKSFETNQVGIVGDRNALAADLDTLRQDRLRLEQVAVDATKLLQEKDAEIGTLKGDVRLGHEAQDKLQDKIKELKRELTSKDNTAQDLKSKIAELYVEFQTCNQNKILAESEIKSLQSEIKSLSTGKEWYQDQLHAVQESKSQLQRDITKIKSEMISQSTLIEKLKVENIRVKQHLSETEQRGLREKEMLARHLEAIEMDIVDREAAFAQIQQERQTMESALQQKSGEVPQDLEDDLKKSKNDVRRYKAQTASLEHERTELVKRIALAQESIAERDRNIEEIERKLVDLEVSLKQSQLEITTKDDEVNKMRLEKSAMDVELSRAKEEKKTFDSALHTLKADMEKVEHSFKVMKSELSDKQSELARLRGVNESLKDRIARGEKEMIERESVQQAALTTQDVPYKVDPSLLQELDQLREKEASYKGQVALLQNESSDSMKAVMSQNQSLLSEIESLKTSLENSHASVQVVREEKDAMQKDLMSTKERILELDLNYQNVIQEKEELLRKNDAMAIVQEQTQTTINSNSETQRYEKENDSLRSQLASLQTESHKQIAKLKAKALKLGKDLEAALKQHREFQRQSEVTVAEADNKYKNIEEQRNKLQEELKLLQEKFSLDLDDKTKQLQTELQTYKKDVESLREEKQTLEKQVQEYIVIHERTVAEYTSRITVVERELIESREYIQVNQKTQEESQQLAIELERERGRLAGLLANYETLKEHAGKLEAQLAEKESSAVAVSSEVSEKLQRSGREIVELREGQSVIEHSLEAEKQTSDDLRKQLAKEKELHAQLRRETEQLWLEHDQRKVDVEQKAKAIETMLAEKETSQEKELNLKMEIEKLHTEQQGVAMERERLQREVDERQSRDPFIQEQINTMQWQLSEKSSEIENLKSRVKMAEERRDMEVSSLKQTLQSTTSELNSLREELAAVKVERSNQQAKISDLKHSLKTLVEHTKVIQTHGGQAAPPLPLDMSRIELILQDRASPSQSKPVSFLKATLSGLRGEISILQKQAEEHIEAIQTSNKAWEELEEQVKDLRQICRNSAADRQASEKILLETASVTSLASDSGIQPLDGAPIKLADMNLSSMANGGDEDGASSEVLTMLKTMNLISQSEGAPVVYSGQTKSVTVTKK